MRARMRCGSAGLQHNISLRSANRQRDRPHNDAIWGCAACRYMATLRQQVTRDKVVSSSPQDRLYEESISKAGEYG